MKHVGIDLGTTHSALAVVDSDAGAGGIPARLVAEVLPIEQLVSFGRTESRPLLASALHVAVEESEWSVGEFARRRALELPSRSIVSAKSWLSNANVAREDAILPWASDDPTAPRLSPVDASAAVLCHLVQNAQRELGPASAWDVTLTVPASFDDVARSLTVRAAERAGLTVRLLEEPIAAFGDFLELGGSTLAPAVQTVLVVDVGGGTADFSLLARRSGVEPSFERIATGHHLLLGGDNVDLALGHLLESRLGEELSPMRFA
ncbi:Hsp70 family protein, partial [bacterium]